MTRSRVLPQILALDPVQDHQRIVQLSLGHDFPWDTGRSLELALFRTFASPSISRLLDAAGEFQHRPQRRYDDTGLLLSALFEHGYDSEPGRIALRRLNQIHQRFPISNEDYLYVLSTFIYEPIRWIDRFGWRPMVQQERLGLFHLWRQIGKRMGIQQIPEAYEELDRFNQDYEARYFRFAESNRRVAEAARGLMLGWFPAALRPICSAAIGALLDDRALAAFGFPAARPATRRAVIRALQLRARLVRHLPRRRESVYFNSKPVRSYPDGYRLEQLGPEEAVIDVSHKPIPLHGNLQHHER